MLKIIVILFLGKYLHPCKKTSIKEIKMIQKYRSIGSSKMEVKHWFHGLFYLFIIYMKDLLKIKYKK